MCTRMTHPEHGSTHAYGTDDIQRLRGYGWVPDDELKAKAEQAEKVKVRQKPGPKPKPKAE